MATPALAQETIPPGEAASIEALLAVFKNESIKNNPTGTMHRGAHAKLHGLVKAEFVVPDDLAPELRVGIFSQPKTYQAWVRFSNGDGTHKPDHAKDARGMAIKVMGVPGDKLLSAERGEQTQDFILMSTPAFVSKGAQDVVELAQALFGSVFAKLWHLLTHWRTLWLLLKLFRRFANPLQIRYFSCTPYLFGTRAVKYAATPLVDVPDTIPRDRADDYLRAALVAQLKAGEAQFDFCVQFQTDARAMPIEDPRCEWSESVSPFRKVATLRILRQDCDSAQQRAFAENLSFTPWHALPEHRPLGGINRARKVVYEAMSTFRHGRNQAPRQEPTGWAI